MNAEPDDEDAWPKSPWRPWSDQFDWKLHKKLPKLFKPAHYYQSLTYHRGKDAKYNLQSSIGDCGVSAKALIAYDFVTVSQFNSFINTLEQLGWYDAYRPEINSLQWLREWRSNPFGSGSRVILKAVQNGDEKIFAPSETRLDLPHWCQRVKITAITVNPALIALRFTFSFRSHYEEDIRHLAQKSYKTEFSVLPKGGWEIREPRSQKKRSIHNKRKAWKTDIEDFISSHLSLELSKNSNSGVPIFEICELDNIEPIEEHTSEKPDANLMEIIDLSWSRHKAWIYNELEGFVLFPRIDTFDAQEMLYTVILANSVMANKTFSESYGRRMTGWTISEHYSKALLGFSIDHLLRHYNSVLVKMRDDLSETSGLKKTLKNLKNASVYNQRRQDIEAIIGDFSKSKKLKNFQIRSENLSPLEPAYYTKGLTIRDFLSENISTRIKVLKDLDRRYEKQLLSTSHLVSAWASLNLSRAVLIVGLLSVFVGMLSVIMTILSGWDNVYSEAWLKILNHLEARQ